MKEILLWRHACMEFIHISFSQDHKCLIPENIFVIRNGVVTTTPKTAAILPGITRDTVITMLKELGYEVREENIPRESMYVADEILMCGTAAEVTPVRSVDGIPVGNGGRGPITKEVQDMFFGLFNGKTEDKWGWLDPVK